MVVVLVVVLVHVIVVVLVVVVVHVIVVVLVEVVIIVVVGATGNVKLKLLHKFVRQQVD